MSKKSSFDRGFTHTWEIDTKHVDDWDEEYSAEYAEQVELALKGDGVPVEVKSPFRLCITHDQIPDVSPVDFLAKGRGKARGRNAKTE